MVEELTPLCNHLPYPQIVRLVAGSPLLARARRALHGRRMCFVIRTCLLQEDQMKNPTRRQVLEAGSATALTAVLGPFLGDVEGTHMGRTDSSEEICFKDATELMELLRTKRLSAVTVMEHV